MPKQKNVLSLWQQVVPIPKIWQKQSLHSARAKFGKIPPAIVEKFKRQTPQKSPESPKFCVSIYRHFKNMLFKNPTTLNLQKFWSLSICIFIINILIFPPTPPPNKKQTQHQHTQKLHPIPPNQPEIRPVGPSAAPTAAVPSRCHNPPPSRRRWARRSPAWRTHILSFWKRGGGKRPAPFLLVFFI